MFYNDQILQLFRHPQHAGQLPDGMQQVKTARNGNPGQTDVVQLQLQIINNKIIAGKFKCSGTVTTIACAEYLLNKIINQSLAEAMSYTSEQLIADLQLPEQRRHSALLVIDCLHKVLKND